MLGGRDNLADSEKQVWDNHKEMREILSSRQEQHLQRPWSLREPSASRKGEVGKILWRRGRALAELQSLDFMPLAMGVHAGGDVNRFSTEARIG